MASGTGTFGPGTITITAANGDKLNLVHRGTFSLVMTPDGLTSVFDMTWVVAGGTGRFAGARGAGITHGVVAPLDGHHGRDVPGHDQVLNNVTCHSG